MLFGELVAHVRALMRCVARRFGQLVCCRALLLFMSRKMRFFATAVVISHPLYFQCGAAYPPLRRTWPLLKIYLVYVRLRYALRIAGANLAIRSTSLLSAEVNPKLN